MTALQAEGCGLPLCGNAYKVSVTDSPFCVIWYDKHSADWLTALASPYPASPDFPPQAGGKVVAPATKGGMHSLARRAVVKVLL